ncbi:MAG: anion transporter [Anaerolineales bacterium]|nr:anion transporter [Anaerolineales bacterium]MCX7608695.1 anion transporter [Anaerolineales bacterium]MDW8228126.1 anion transporter [Anaerolineales bacterium]
MTFYLTALIITITYVGIALGGYPGLRVNRTTLTLIGVGALLGLGLLDFKQLGSLLEINTLVLLFGMMIINANLQLAGFFRLAGASILKFTRSPRALLALEILVAGVLSALFLNDTICIMLTPLIVDVTLTAKRNPVPYLIALATAANIGSVATLTGNPQNMIIGIASGLSYLEFAAALTPIALLSLVVIWVVLVLFYPQEFRRDHFDHVEIPDPRVFRPLLAKSLIVTVGLLVAFVLGVPIAEAAFVAGCILLFTRRVRPEKVMNEVDWNLLVFFAALFILTGVIELYHLTDGIFAALASFLERGAAGLSLITVIMSNLVSNVPAVLLLRPAVMALPNPTAGWLTLAVASTLAGNLTLLGSVANLIVAESAAKRGIKLTFWEYTKAGLLITVLSLAIGIAWIQLFIWK